DGAGVDLWSTEFMFLGDLHPEAGSAVARPFLRQDDSGSAVFDKAGCVVGLLFRGHAPQRTEKRKGITYVTSIEDVFESIKKILKRFGFRRDLS
ncbi:hypothetical protein B0T14DRAFT_430778, partial [Immersiella caudata]